MLFMCFFFFGGGGVIPFVFWGEKTHKQISPENPVKNCVYVSFLFFVLSLTQTNISPPPPQKKKNTHTNGEHDHVELGFAPKPPEKCFM